MSLNSILVIIAAVFLVAVPDAPPIAPSVGRLIGAADDERRPARCSAWRAR